MSRRISLPGADELFRKTTLSAVPQRADGDEFDIALKEDLGEDDGQAEPTVTHEGE